MDAQCDEEGPNASAQETASNEAGGVEVAVDDPETAHRTDEDPTTPSHVEIQAGGGVEMTPSGCRRRGLDRAREVEAERAYEGATREAEEKAHEWREERLEAGHRVFFGAESPSSEAAAVDAVASAVSSSPAASRNEGLATTEALAATGLPATRTAAAAAAASDAACGGVATNPASLATSSSSNLPSTLRRIKQLDASQAEAIEMECGVKIKPTSDIFRLVLRNASSALSPETNLLLVTISDSFLCEAPPREAAEEGAGAEADASTAAASAAEPSAIPAATSTKGGEVEVELFFFRSKVMPSVGGRSIGSLAKKLDKVPVLHVTVSTSDGLSQAFEFLGVHQRQYYVHSDGQDAFARNLEESLLKVVLEFIFHPSRSKYTREHLILRECGASAEALLDREELLPAMVEQIRLASEKIRTYSIEYTSQRVPDVSKGRSMLVVDERMLEVAFARNGGVPSTTKATKAAFNGFGRGFLNGGSSSSKRKIAPACSEKRAMAATIAEEPTSMASSSPAAAAGADIGSAGHAASSSGVEASSSASAASDMTPPHGPAAARTSRDEKLKLLLPAGDLSSQMTEDIQKFEREIQAGFGAYARSASSTLAGQPDEDLEDGIDDPNAPTSLSELASQLFGDGDLDLDFEVGVDDRTESTGTPSVEASHTCATSEHSENTEDGGDSGEFANNPGGVGLRLLQQRRRRLPEASQNQSPAQDQEADDLVALWMKQRW